MQDKLKVSVIKVGYTSPNFYSDEVEQLEAMLGVEFNSTIELKQAICEKLGLTIHARPKMSEEEKLSNSISKIAQAKGITDDQLNKVLALLKLA